MGLFFKSKDAHFEHSFLHLSLAVVDVHAKALK